MLQNLITCSVLVLTLISAMSDLRTAKIRNEIFLAGVLLGLTMNAGIGGWRGAGYSLLGLIVPMLVFLPLSSNNLKIFGLQGIKVIGMGDVKLFGFVGALVCFPDVFKIIFLTYVLGGVYSLVLMLNKKILKNRIVYFFSWFSGYIKNFGKNEYISTVRIKFAPFVFIAVCSYYLYTAVF